MINEMTASLTSNTDLEARNQTIAELYEWADENVIYIPIHHQVLNWGMADGWSTVVDADDQVKFKYFATN
jgi:peptide/nickel transport system substrate-binding protein